MADRPLSFWIKAIKTVLPLVREFQAIPEADRRDWKKLLPLAQRALVALQATGLTFEDLADLVGNAELLELVEALT